MKKTAKKFLVKIGRGYQITIPKEIVKALKLKVGDLLEATLDKKKHYMILTPIKRPQLVKEIAPGITVDKKVAFGKPVIKGTRIPAELIIGQLLGGMTKEEIMKKYDLTKEHIEAAVAFGLKKTKLSHGKAAELLNIDRWDLVDFMAKYQIPAFPLTKAQLDTELRHLRRRRSQKS